MVNNDTQPHKTGDNGDSSDLETIDSDDTLGASDVDFNALKEEMQGSVVDSIHGDDEDDGDDGEEYPETLPPGLTDDNEIEIGLSLENEDEHVDPDEIGVPRPHNPFVIARSLDYDKEQFAREGEFAEKDDAHEHDSECFVECECGAEEHNQVVLDNADVDHKYELTGAQKSLLQDCECEFECVCTHHSETGTRFYKLVPYVRQTIDAVEIDSDERTSLYGVVAGRWDPSGMDNEIRVRIADTTGVVDVLLYTQMDLPAFEPGDEILVADLAFDGESEDGDFTATEESVVKLVKDSSIAVGAKLRERSQLERAGEMFDEYDSTQAVCEWAADIIVDEWHIETPYGSENTWMYCDDEEKVEYGLLVNNGGDRIRELVDEYFPRGTASSRNKNEIVSQIRDKTRVDEDALSPGSADHEARRWSVAVENGVVDLRTGELHEFDPAWRCRQKIPIRYDPDEPAQLGSEWEWFLDDITKGESDKEVLLYAIAHGLCRHYPHQFVAPVIGPGGNGKTVWSKSVKALYGDASGGWKIQAMCGDDDFGAGSLIQKHIVIDDDATDVKLHHTTPLKKHSGGDAGEVNEKFIPKNHDYENYATLVYLANKPPIFDDKSDGLKRRLYPAILPYKYTSDPTDGHKDKIDEDELLARLTAGEELEALLRVAVKYAQQMYNSNGIDDGRTREERWELYQQYSDSILQFWQECAVQDRGTRVPTSVWYEIYVRFCEANGIEPVSRKGRNSFWSLSDACPVISYKREGVWLGDDLATEHVMLSQEALKYAPDWVREEWSDEVDEDTQTLGNRLDRVAPIADIKSKGYCTTEGRVIGRETVDTKRGVAVKLTIEDETRAIDVWEYPDDESDAKTDVAKHGDKVTFKRAVLTSNRGEPMLKVVNVTEVTVAEAGPLSEVDDRHVTESSDGSGEVVKDGVSEDVWTPVVPGVPEAAQDALNAVRADGGGDTSDSTQVPQQERVRVVKNLVERGKMSDTQLGAPVEDVIAGAESKGLTREQVEHVIQSLKKSGDVYEPQSGVLRAT